MLWAVFLLLVFEIWILPDRFLSVMDKWNVIYRTLPFYSVRTNMQVKMGLPKRKAHCMVLLILR